MTYLGIDWITTETSLRNKQWIGGCIGNETRKCSDKKHLLRGLVQYYFFLPEMFASIPKIVISLDSSAPIDTLSSAAQHAWTQAAGFQTASCMMFKLNWL